MIILLLPVITLKIVKFDPISYYFTLEDIMK